MIRHQSNLAFISKLPKGKMPGSNPWKTTEEHMIKRNEWLQRQITKYFTEEELRLVLDNRRSEFSESALISDFMKCEFSDHPIPIDYNIERAIDAVTDHFRPNRPLHPVSFPDLRYYNWKLPVSAEAPWTSRDFRFTPTGRNVDEESGLNRVTQKKERRKLKKFTKPTKVGDYLKFKQKMGLIENDSISFHNLYNEIFVFNRPLIHQIKEKGRAFWYEDGTPKPYQWNTLHARSHVVKGATPDSPDAEPDKIRAVFGAPKLLLMAELMFIWPLQATYLNTEAGRLLWGREMSRGGWKRIQREIFALGTFNTIIGLDWSQFDKRLLHQLIRIIHKIFRSYFDFSRYEPTSIYPDATPRDPKRIDNLWEWMCAAITGTPILLPNGELWRWNWNGFGSGFQQTQLMDTFANAVMIYTCLSALGIDINSERFWARFQGDDSLITTCENMARIYGLNFLDMLEEAANHYFNAKLNVKKSQIQDNMTGLSVLSYFNWYGTPYRDEIDLLRHLYFPERPQDFGRLAASAIGLAQASLGSSERFFFLCKRVFDKIVIEHKTRPKWSILRWMERAGQEEVLKSLKEDGFPTFLKTLSDGLTPVLRTESEKQGQWPTKPGVRIDSKGRDFYFLLAV
jgi:hypothetical protein